MSGARAVLGVLETCLYAGDLDAAEHFYADVLGLTAFQRERGRHVFFRCGDSVFLVFDPAATRVGSSVPSHGAEGVGHVAFEIGPGELDGWRRYLREHGVPVEAEIAWPRGGISLYVRDPAGNSVELAERAIWAGPLRL